MGRCALCGGESKDIAEALRVCLPCIRSSPGEARTLAMEAHRRSRARYGLPLVPPRAAGGVPCNLCVNECSIPQGAVGYCGLRRNDGGRLAGATSRRGKLSWYHDPLPTNCVGDWVCAGGTGAGYPIYAHCRGPEHGYKNLAVFFQACSFNCLFCQNWHFHEETTLSGMRTVEELVNDVDSLTSCICYFGGDPAPQLPFSLRASRLARDRSPGRILRVCWETNGSMHPGLLDSMMDMASESGGCVKFDLKAWSEDLHVVLTGVTNRRTLENFTRAGERLSLRRVPPLLITSTLLIPGYTDTEEVGKIACFIAGIDPHIPYSLLGFFPDFLLSDLPRTPRALAEDCLRAAREAGLKNVRLGNLHLLTEQGVY